GWHRGVIGLTAGRIAQRYHRPTLVISIEGGGTPPGQPAGRRRAQGDLCVGSARSIPSIDLHARLEAVQDLFSHFGGHPFACGFSLNRDDLEELRERLTESFEALDAEL